MLPTLNIIVLTLLKIVTISMVLACEIIMIIAIGMALYNASKSFIASRRPLR
jgi:hypothetical protein